MFENHRIVSFYIASEASKVDKSSLKMPKMVNLASFWKTEVNVQIVLPDRPLLIGQKLMKNAKIETFK